MEIHCSQPSQPNPCQAGRKPLSHRFVTHFKAPWGASLHALSWPSTALLLGISFMAARNLGAWDLEHGGLWGTWLPPLVILICSLFTVRGYSLAPHTLLVHRLLWRTRIDLAGLQSVTADPKAFRGAIRTCGNGGLFSFSGFYWSKHLGHFRPYVTNLQRGVVLRLPSRSVVVSPADPEAFVRECQSVANQA